MDTSIKLIAPNSTKFKYFLGFSGRHPDFRAKQMAKESFFGKLPLFYAIAGAPIPLALATIAANLAVCLNINKTEGMGVCAWKD